MCYGSQEERICHAGKGHMGKHQGESWDREEIGGNCGQEPLYQFPQYETDKVGQGSLGLASLNNFSRFWATGTISVIGTRVIRAGG